MIKFDPLQLGEPASLAVAGPNTMTLNKTAAGVTLKLPPNAMYVILE